MKEIIGRTRNGRQVWIEVISSNHARVALQVVEFSSSEDNYDAYCIVEAYRRRMKILAEQHRMELPATIAQRLDVYLNSPKPSGFNSEALALGHRTAPDRLRYGMRLLHPAYRW